MSFWLYHQVGYFGGWVVIARIAARIPGTDCFLKPLLQQGYPDIYAGLRKNMFFKQLVYMKICYVRLFNCHQNDVDRSYE